HASSQNTHQDRRFKSQVGALEVPYPDAKVNAQSEGNGGKQHEQDISFARAAGGKQQLLELERAPQGAGHCGGYPHLQQELYAQILQVHSPIFSLFTRERCKFRLRRCNGRYALAAENRARAKEPMSSAGGLPVITSAMIFAVTGARRMPLRKCPLATNTPGTSVGPRMGRSSGAPG